MSDVFGFDEEAAKKSGTMGIRSGVHEVTIEECKRGKGTNGTTPAIYVEFVFESDSGAKAQFVKLYLTGNNGEKVFGAGKWSALLGLLGLTEVSWKVDGDKQVTPTLLGKKIKVGLQKREYYNRNGEKKYGFEITHFFDIKTGCTYSEKRDNKPAKMIELPIEDIASVAKTNSGIMPDGASIYDDQNNPLPF